MTGPIVFTPMPYPNLDDDADGVLAEQNSAVIAKANFDLINPWFQRNPNRCTAVRSAQQVTLTNPANDGVWRAFAGAQWPAMTFTLPDVIVAVIVTVNGENYGDDNVYAYTSFKMTGAGLPAGNDVDRAALMAGSGHAYGCRTTVLYPPNTPLQAGQPVTVTPYWRTSGAGYRILANGRLDVVCLYGGPQT
jgi:hypothetical protein